MDVASQEHLPADNLDIAQFQEYRTWLVKRAGQAQFLDHLRFTVNGELLRSLGPGGKRDQESGKDPHTAIIVAIVTFWKKLFSRKPEPLRGAPDVRRLKTYSAESGFVYLYSFSGLRINQRDTEVGTEYVFEVTSDRKNWWYATVFLGHSLMNEWMRHHSRDLSASERYGIAKIALNQMFDSIEQNSVASAICVSPDVHQLDTIAHVLDLL